MRKKLKSVLILFGNACSVFFGNISNVWTKESCHWTINETIFYGDDAENMRNEFQNIYHDTLREFAAKQNSKINFQSHPELNTKSVYYGDKAGNSLH